MVHELMPKGIQNNIVNMKGVAGINKDIEEIVLSPASDDFFRQHMFSNYGDIGEAVRRLLDEYSSSHKIHESAWPASARAAWAFHNFCVARCAFSSLFPRATVAAPPLPRAQT
jgi:hypothetical protein